MKNEWEFLEDKIVETKKEIKARKQWQKALLNEYCKTNREETRVRYNQAYVMIKHYENILKEQEEMLKELKEVR